MQIQFRNNNININFFSSNSRPNSVSVQALEIIANRIQEMYDRITKNMGNFYRQRRRKSAIMVVFGAIYFLVATAGFAFQAYLTISRYMKHEFQQSSITMQNQSLFMPVITLELYTNKNNKTEIMKQPVEMKFDVTLENEKLPKWAFKEHHKINQHILTANTINKVFMSENFTFENAKSTVFLKIFASMR